MRVYVNVLAQHMNAICISASADCLRDSADLALQHGDISRLRFRDRWNTDSSLAVYVQEVMSHCVVSVLAAQDKTAVELAVNLLNKAVAGC